MTVLATRGLLWCAAIYALTVSAAWADGVTRPATQAEKEFLVRVRTTLAQSFPQPFPGFETRQATALVAPDRVDTGCERVPMRTDYHIGWIHPALAEEEGRAEAEAVENAAAQSKASSAQARQKALTAKLQKLSEAYGQAVQRQDQKAAAKIQKELEALGRELEAAGEAQTAMVDRETQGLAYRSRLDVRVQVNQYHESLPNRMIQDMAPAPGVTAYAYYGSEGKAVKHVAAMVGPWKKKRAGSQAVYEAQFDPQRDYLQVQTIRIYIYGDMELTQKFMAGIDWPRLKKLAGL